MKITDITGTSIILMGDDIDTDRMIPARFLKEITFERMGEYLFYDSRFTQDGAKKEHPLNDERFKGANILIVGRNFGCGSSREHAAHAIKRFGIDAIIGESFSPIFMRNCQSLGVPVVMLPRQSLSLLVSCIEDDPKSPVRIDLTSKTISFGEGKAAFSMDDSVRNAFLEGYWNLISVMMANADKAREVEARLPKLV